MLNATGPGAAPNPVTPLIKTVTYDLYREPLRGQFHVSSQRGWTNDPNGLVFFNGEYHLFYQHNPHGCEWGDMHWGHATSRDLVHWQQHDEALSPDDVGPIFSGSAVVDWNDTSGLGKAGQPPLVLIYTAAGPRGGESIASSTDGRIFTKYALNPVIRKFVAGDRDPKVFWHKPTRKWVMVLYGGPQSPGGERTTDGMPAEQHTLYFFTSPNLRDWTLVSSIQGGIGDDHYHYDCPDLFVLPVDGDAARKKWVLMAADSEYAVGVFDGTTFKAEHSRIRGNFGRGFYAPQTFCDAPDGRRIQIGWFKTVTPGMPFNQSMSIPHELKLIATADGPRIIRAPVKEMELLRAKSHRLGAMILGPESANPLAGIKAELVELRAAFEPGDASTVAFTVRGAEIAYEAKSRELIVNRLRVSAPLHGGRQCLTIFCDRTGLEIFASDGLVYVTFPFQPNAGDLALEVKATSGRVKFTALDVHELKSIWPASARREPKMPD